MKKRFPGFLSGCLTTLTALALSATALAASGQVTFSFANVALDGETKLAAGTTITAANGQQVPSSILYTDAAGGKTNYLPIRAISELLGVEIGYDLQNALREELYNRNIYDIPVATMITQVRVDADDPAFDAPSKPIGHFMTEEQAKIAEEKYGYIMKEDSGRGYRRVVASPKPAEIVEIGAIRSLVDSGQLVIACGGGGIPVTRQGNHLKGASAVIDKDFASELLAENLDADFLIILTAVEKVAINFGKPEEKWLDDLETEEARKYIKEGHFAPGSMLPKVQAAVKFAESKPGRTALITLLEKAKDGIQGKTGTHIHLA